MLLTLLLLLLRPLVVTLLTKSLKTNRGGQLVPLPLLTTLAIQATSECYTLHCSAVLKTGSLHTFASLLAVAKTAPSGCTATSSTHDSCPGSSSSSSNQPSSSGSSSTQKQQPVQDSTVCCSKYISTLSRHWLPHCYRT
jgi:hypothetical protein